jgi:hypothetical protein
MLHRRVRIGASLWQPKRHNSQGALLRDLVFLRRVEPAWRIAAVGLLRVKSIRPVLQKWPDPITRLIDVATATRETFRLPLVRNGQDSFDPGGKWP